MSQINREDMLELTRRMNVKRNCFSRIAGAYIDQEGYVDDTFNISFLDLTILEKQINIAIAKAIPFSDTNVELKDYRFDKNNKKSEEIRHLLRAINQCGLKNDALLYSLYEHISKYYKSNRNYAIYIFHGIYDIPLKGSDKESQWDSEEVYAFIICAICPVGDDYEAGAAECGFLFPTFTNRSSDSKGIAVYQNDDYSHPELVEEILF